MISALVLTLNEEQNIERCLRSLSWADEMIVLDSFSTDRTVELAKAAGARVIQRKFDDWSTHQNWALDNIGFRNRWVYYSDADEVVTPELRDELLAIAANPGETHAAFRLRYKNYFMSRWIRHCGIYPTWVLRFFRPEKVRWNRVVNPVPVVDGDIGHLEGHFEHYSFDKGLAAWVEKHNRYSTGEAVETIAALERGGGDWRGLFASDPARRRRALKELSFRLPMRPLLRFTYMYIGKRGFLDGRPGLAYCSLLAFYELMIVLKAEELRAARLPNMKVDRPDGGQPSPAAADNQLLEVKD